MAVITTSKGTSLVMLDPVGWAELVEKLHLEDALSALMGQWEVDVVDTRGFHVKFRPWVDLPEGGRAVDDDQVIEVELSKTETDEAGGRFVMYQEILGRLTCTACGDRLLSKEVAICGACESRSAMDMIALARELRAEG